MPKKKKKGRSSTGEDAHSSPQWKDTSIVTPIENDVVDFVPLQIIPSSTPPVKTLQYAPMVVLTGDDADRLDVIAGDSVLLLAQESRKGHIFATTIARVHVVNTSSTPSPAKSPVSISKTQRSKLSAGNCHVFPTTLAQQLQNPSRDGALKESNMSQSTMPETPPPSGSIMAPSPSPSKSKFSFAKGGGGDHLITSSSTLAAEYRPSIEKMTHYTNLWVVPVESELGDELTGLLGCKPASRIQMDIADKTGMGSSLTSAQKVLHGSLGKSLIRAHLLSSYLSNWSLVNVSVQGQSIPCRVIDIVDSSSSESAPTLEADMRALSITEDRSLDPCQLSSPQHLIATVKKSIIARQSEHANDRVLLFQVNRTTAIVFGADNAIEPPSTENSSQSAINPLLAGLDDTIERVQSLLLTPLLHPELFQTQRQTSLRPPKGVLLYGTSGSGKSKLALQVAQTIRQQHKVHIQDVSCAKLQSQTALVGQAEQLLVRYFDSATRQASPGTVASLIILDDVHLICPRRQGMNVGADRLAATLLALLDGLDSSSSSNNNSNNKRHIKPHLTRTAYHPIMVLAVTNNPSLLDPAIRRPGRLDAEVEVPLPDEPSTRSLILQFQISKFGATINWDSDEWIRLARMAKGFTGADLELAAKEAIRIAFLRRNAEGATDRVIELEKTDVETAIRSIKPSAIKAVTVEIPQVPWSSIGGMEEVKRQLREAIELPLTHSAMFEKMGIRPPRGVLLYGPPGCSKTLMARALATEGHMNFLAVKGPELLSKWLGESERALASLFRRARLASPSVIFFDEVDAIATKRDGGNAGGGERLLSQLLTELDGIQSGTGKEKQRVVVVCATNRPDLLDGALMRPGRIDRMIYVGVPDRESRFRILELGLKDRACDSDIDLSVLSEDKISGGLSGAELVSACRNAALFALQEAENLKLGNGFKEPSIGMQHMLLALKECDRQITPDMIDFYLRFKGQESSTD